MLTTRVLCLMTVLALAGCGGGGGGSPSAATPPVGTSPTPPTPTPPSSVLIEGAVQKGPFIVGSTVLINRLDNRGRSTPSTLLAEIDDSIGSFSFETDQRGPVQIVATGYYFSELTGQISGGQLTLRALYEVGSDARQVAHVNILTHLINDRVLELISDGTPGLDEAIEQAEDELVAALSEALVISNLNEFSALSLYDSGSAQNNTLGNAYLLALSTGFYKYAETKAREFATATDAELTLTLNRFSDDLADDGRLEPGPFIREFVTAIRSLSPETIAANLRSRSLVDYPQGLGVPDISIFLSLCAGNFECPWSAGAPMPLPIAGHAAAVHGGKVYVFGGQSVPGPCCHADVSVYDPVKNEWAPRRAMPEAGRSITAHTIGDKIYVVAGQNLFLQTENWLYAYDPVADQWSVRADRPTYRQDFASAVVDGKLYVVGGYGSLDNGPANIGAGGEHKSHVEIYDPMTDRWSPGIPLPTALAQSRACVVDNQIYVFGGSSAAGGFERTILTYSPTSSSWSAKAPMLHARYAFECVTVDGAVYFLGGFGLPPVGSINGPVERYDPFVETWSSPTRMHTPRYQLSAAVVGTRIFTFGGGARGTTTTGDRAVDVVEILDTEQL